MLNQQDISRLRQMVAEAKQAAIVAHINPDGDAVGATMALQGYLQQFHPHLIVQAVFPNQPPAFLMWVEGAKSSFCFATDKEKTLQYLQQCDLIFFVDFNNVDRLEELGARMRHLTARKVLIDHHPQPDDGFDLEFSDPSMSATCELMYLIMDALGDAKKLSVATAEALYMGILTDTGSFSYGIQTPSTFRVAADLMALGIDKNAIYSRVFDSYSEHRVRLLGYTLKDKMVVHPERKAAYIYLSRQELNDYHFEVGDTENFVNYPLSIKGIELSAFLYENLDASHVRVSLRSRGKNISVNELARTHFKGGGHFNAAGGKFFGTLAQCCAYFEEILQTIK
ncbi:exopolyphosphatase [Bacteroidia bacterium]|nr:exopolyphosphatase [Bacteroidia bacterium]